MPLDSSPGLDPILARTAMEFWQQQDQFIAGRIAPTFSTAKSSGSYYVDSIENTVSTPGQGLERAPGGEYGILSMTLGSDSYNTADRGVTVPVDDTVRAEYADAWDADVSAIRKGVNTILTDREVRLAALITGSGVTAEAMTTLDGTNGNTFVSEVLIVSEEVRKATGIKPNRLIIHPDQWNTDLRGDTQLIARIVSNGAGVINEVTEQALGNILGLEIIVPGAIKATSADGQTVTTGDIWTTAEAYLCHVTPNAEDLSAPTSFRNFSWTGGTGGSDIAVVSSRAQLKKSDMHQIYSFDDIKLTSANLTRQLTGL